LHRADRQRRSGVGDPNTGVAVYDSANNNGGWTSLGGVQQGIIGGMFGLAGPTGATPEPAALLYNDPAGFNDVRSGTDVGCTSMQAAYLCTAGAGYDGPTGNGTPAGIAAFARQQTTTSLGSSTSGQSVMLLATVARTAGVAAPTGAVTFRDGLTTLGSAVTVNSQGEAQLTTTALGIGSHSITASYAGDSLYAPSSSSTVTVSVTAPVPVLSSPHEAHARWAAHSGTTFSFTLNTPAPVTLKFTRLFAGRRTGKRCVAETRKNRQQPHCPGSSPAGTLNVPGHAGTNAIAFKGKLSNGRTLPPGSYLVALSARGQHGVAVTLKFTIT
jgi:hypothetical protein